MPDQTQPSQLPSGLSAAEAAIRQQAEGYNELPRPDRRGLVRIVREVLQEPMLALLVAGGVIYLILGSLQDALILLGFAMMSVVITVVQESRTERVLEALRDLTSPRALVIRDGGQLRIAGRDVVRGDILLLSEGDRVPADAILLQAQDFQADESLLTGESVPVRKAVAAAGQAGDTAHPGGDDRPHVFAGSLVVRGTGTAEVIAIGALSEIGKIGQALSSLEAEPPRLQVHTRRLARIFGGVGAVVSVAAILLYGLTRGGWLDAVLAGIALGMSMLPEEFPLVLTVFMAMGAWRISKARVLTRRASAIETLGSATVLCTDKTGTLTENRMSVAALRLPGGETFKVTPGDAGTLPQFVRLSEAAMLACAPDPFDPMERAIRKLAGAAPPDAGGTLLHTYGLRPDLLAMSNIWQLPGGATPIVAAKGAPEAIAGLCRMKPEALMALQEAVNSMAGEGLRVLGVARAAATNAPWPVGQTDFAFEFLGLIGLADPLRASVPAAVAQCRAAGIRVVMITGDYPATARAIAEQAGLETRSIITGDMLAKMDDAELTGSVHATSVFARIMPAQKLRIVNALKAKGEIVAMTGDGVNDAPSLKAAHIGIAMGGRGTDVAREASSIILLDDDFGSIVASIRLGRRIYDNLRKAMGFIVAVHVPIAGLALLPLVLGMPILFGPMHIAFLEMVIDPVCSLVFEAETEEDDVMNRPPRPPESPLFSGSLIAWSLLQGFIACGLVGLLFVLASGRGMPEAEVRALTFFALVAAILGLILVNRSFSSSLLKALWRPNRVLLLVYGAVTAMLALTLLLPPLQAVFRFGPLHADDLGLVLGTGVVVLLLLEVLKRPWRVMLRS